MRRDQPHLAKGLADRARAITPELVGHLGRDRRARVDRPLHDRTDIVDVHEHPPTRPTYGVFLLSRIKEAHDGGAPTADAVAIGLERVGRIATAAAVLFAVAIGAFVTSEMIFIKQLGLGTALAVLIDATIIRALLVPSLMKTLGKWNWWGTQAAAAAARPARSDPGVTGPGAA